MPDIYLQRVSSFEDQKVSRQLAQTRPNLTTVASLYTPGDGVQCIVKKIFICNTSAGDALFDLFHDDDGTTYDETTQLFKDQTVVVGMTRIIERDLFVDSPGNIAVATDTSLALTFSLYGEEVQVRAR